jgi:tetratricopeptide (TPR) repeat protein
MLKLPGSSARWIFVSLALALLCLATPVAADADDAKDVWVEVRSPHFVVSSNGGEKQARHVAQQFEEIRGVFQSAFSKLRVDPGKPILILAAKNENTMKALLPGYWEQKGHVQPAGIYIPGEEKHYVALRLDSEEENPFHTLYHEYTHALIHLNFAGLPPWLDEGLAEFYGNTVINGKDIQTGKIDKSHLYLLQESKLIPVDVLLQVDHTSPYYNEQNRASVFYAESWALVHFLMLDPEARKQKLLTHFLDAWQKSGNQVEAAKQSFGDLTKFGKQIEAYARQRSFYLANIKSSVQSDEKSYASRALPPGESLALRGDFYLQTNRMAEAKAALEAAVKEDPKLAAAHESLGTYYFRQHDIEDAAKELERATELDSKSFLTYYYSAMLNLQQARAMPEAWPKAEASLEKAIALNPSFAPAYANLATLYSIRKEDQEKALTAARRATELEPGTLAYALNMGHVLLNMNKTEEARALATRILAAAKNPQEMRMAEFFQREVEGRTGRNPMLASAADPDSEDADPPALQKRPTQLIVQNENPKTVAEKPKDSPAATASDAATPAAPSGPVNVTQGRAYEMTGKITVLDCSQTPEIALTLALSSIEMKLHAGNVAKLEVKNGAGTKKPGTADCTGWKGRNAKISYHLTPGQNFDGEMIAIQFF